MDNQQVRFKALKGKSAVTMAKMKVEYCGRSIFKFKNGDIYVGGFKVLFPSTITRHGYGLYISEDDMTVYIGDWLEDRMIHGRIKYKNGITYIGNIKHSKYHGKGNYRVPGVGNILSMYFHNKPTAEVVLVDVNGFYWTGAVQEGGGVELCPVNPFHSDPLWHENTSEISMTRVNQNPLTINVPLPIRSDCSLGNVDIKLLSGILNEEYINRFI